jgi:cystathionine gamma-synthase
MSPDGDLGLESVLAHGGRSIDPATGAVVPPIHAATTFARGEDYELMGEFGYYRDGSPTVHLVEEFAARLDGGAGALAFGSGLAAVAALFETVNRGEHVVAPTVAYHGTLEWLERISRRRGIGLTLFEATDPVALGKAVRPEETVIVWIETPVNPTWDVIDLAAAAEIAHRAGARLAVDATVAPPVTTRALDFGADIVFHAATKYLGGHSDVGAGLLVAAEADDRWHEIGDVRRLTGGTLGPFDAWLLLRGMRTLGVRYERASANAMAIARHLEGHPALEAVLYPGLETHPGHDIAARQMSGGFGGMVSLLVAGDAAAARRVTQATRLFVHATSLGGVESLIEHRAVSEPEGSAVPDNLIRLSVGIEAVGDLIADLERALDAL